MEHIWSIVAFVLTVLSLLYYYSISTFGYWKKKSVPCPTGALPGLGHIYPMLFMKRNMPDMFRDLYNKMPGRSMVGFYHLRQPALLVREPELVKTVLLKSFHSFLNNNFALDKELDPLLAVNAFWIDGDRWKATRQQLSSAFTSGKLKYMYQSMAGACVELKGFLEQLVHSSNGNAELELKNLFSRYTSQVVASAAFGVDGESFKSDKDGPFREVGRLMFEPSLLNGLFQTVLLFIPFLGKILGIRFIHAKADQFFRKVVKDVLKTREEQGTQRPDFLQLMIQYKKNNAVDRALGQEFNDDIITAHATSFFVDGYETSSITLSFFGYQLAAHPEVQDRIREEVINVVNKHGGLTYEAIHEMTYMDQALNESMRLFPGFGTFSKVCTKEIELVGSDGITCEVTPGTTVVIPASALHRDPEYWPEPDRFDPDRFSEENKQSRHKFVFLPFGEGPRICPGQRMAVLQIKAAIATMIQNFTWEVSARTKEPIQLDPNYFLAAAVGGLWVNMKRL